jgi:hypothetical protein
MQISLFPVNETGNLEVECYIRGKNGDPNLERGPHTFVDSIDLEPIPCESPTLLQNRAASIALNSLSTLPASLTLSRDLDKMEIWHSADWDVACQYDKEGSIDMQLIECNSPSFSPKRKSITAACLSVEGKFHSAMDSAQFGGKNHMVSVESSTEGSFFGNSSTLNSSPEIMDQSWFIDAIEALESMDSKTRLPSIEYGWFLTFATIHNLPPLHFVHGQVHALMHKLDHKQIT